MKKSEEVWKTVPNYEDYKVSNLGNVMSFKNNNNGIMLKQSDNGKGYFRVTIRNEFGVKTIKVHQLVAMAFLNHKPCGMKFVVNHINGDRGDNNINNLEVITNRENTNRKNLKSKSRFIGVVWDKDFKKWISRIHYNGKRIYLGSFDDEIEAAKYYNMAVDSINNNESIIIKNRRLT